MGSADFKIVRPIGVTADGAFSRAGPKWVFDATGAFVQVAANVLAMTYDPSDLMAAPKPLVELASTNILPSSEDFSTSDWALAQISAITSPVNAPDGAPMIRMTPTATAAGHYFSPSAPLVFVAGSDHTLSLAAAAAGYSWIMIEVQVVTGYIYAFVNMATGQITRLDAGLTIDQAPRRMGNLAWEFSIKIAASTVPSLITFYVSPTASLTPFVAGDGTSGVDFWYVQVEVGSKRSSYMPTPLGASASRAADVFSATAGLSYSNVAIVEPVYSSSASYAKDVTVYDPSTRLVYQSLITSNTGKALTDKTSWTPQPATNRWRVFDKAVNSQTSAPNLLVMAVNAGALVNTMGLLNVNGSRVTVTQMDSGYSKSKSLVRHDVLSWYDWFYEEPIREGDVIFDDVPPYATSPLIISVENPGDAAAIGCLCMGKSRTIGQTDWGFTGGVLSYSTSNQDTFGNITLVRRPNSKTLNFDVYIQPGFESVVYRWMSDYTDEELFIIGAEDYSMTYAYGYLGQWSVPVSNDAKTASIEFKGLV